jgi:hypothetical protein
MYQQLVEELKIRFDQDVELNLSICPNPLSFYEDRVSQFTHGMDFLAKYSSAITEDNVLDILAQVRGEIIDDSQFSFPPEAFISALADICEAKERRMTYEVYMVIEKTKEEIGAMRSSFATKDMCRGCDYIFQMVDWIKSSNLHAELKNIEHSLDFFYRQTVKLIPHHDQDGFLHGATCALSVLKDRWASFDPLIIKPSVKNQEAELCDWSRYTGATSLIRTYSQRLDNYKSGYIMLCNSRIPPDQLEKEVRFFRSVKEHFIRLIDSDFADVHQKILTARDGALANVNKDAFSTSREKTDKIYYLMSITETVVDAALSLKPKLAPELTPSARAISVAEVSISYPRHRASLSWSQSLS